MSFNAKLPDGSMPIHSVDLNNQHTSIEKETQKGSLCGRDITFPADDELVLTDDDFFAACMELDSSQELELESLSDTESQISQEDSEVASDDDFLAIFDSTDAISTDEVVNLESQHQEVTSDDDFLAMFKSDENSVEMQDMSSDSYNDLEEALKSIQQQKEQEFANFEQSSEDLGQATANLKKNSNDEEQNIHIKEQSQGTINESKTTYKEQSKVEKKEASQVKGTPSKINLNFEKLMRANISGMSYQDFFQNLSKSGHSLEDILQEFSKLTKEGKVSVDGKVLTEEDLEEFLQLVSAHFEKQTALESDHHTENKTVQQEFRDTSGSVDRESRSSGLSNKKVTQGADNYPGEKTAKQLARMYLQAALERAINDSRSKEKAQQQMDKADQIARDRIKQEILKQEILKAEIKQEGIKHEFIAREETSLAIQRFSQRIAKGDIPSLDAVSDRKHSLRHAFTTGAAATAA